jgi:hypothetical protein
MILEELSASSRLAIPKNGRLKLQAFFMVFMHSWSSPGLER